MQYVFSKINYNHLQNSNSHKQTMTPFTTSTSQRNYNIDFAVWKYILVKIKKVCQFLIKTENNSRKWHNDVIIM